MSLRRLSNAGPGSGWNESRANQFCSHLGPYSRRLDFAAHRALRGSADWAQAPQPGLASVSLGVIIESSALNNFLLT